MRLRSFSILRREMKNLRYFYNTTCITYDLADSLLESTQRNNQLNEILLKEQKYLEISNQRNGKPLIRERTNRILREVVLVRAISALETFLIDAVKDVFLITKTPFLDHSIQFEFSQSELISNNTPTKILTKVINRETRKLSSGGFNGFIKYYKKRFAIDLASINPGYRAMNEYHDRRNILVHRLGNTDAAYRKKYETTAKRVSIDHEYIVNQINDIQEFCEEVETKIGQFLETLDNNDISQVSKMVIEVTPLNLEEPQCLKSHFQYWADDEYVIMSDILTGTRSNENGNIVYYFNGSDRALGRLKGYLKRERKRGSIELNYLKDLTRPKQNRKAVPESLILEVQKLLPPQPWPPGVHKTIAGKMNVSNTKVYTAIDTLIERGAFKRQKNGVVTGSG